LIAAKVGLRHGAMVALQLVIVATCAAFQSALYPGWATDKEWSPANDSKFIDIRRTCDRIRRSTDGFDLKSKLHIKADQAISEWELNLKSPVKLYRASYLLATARGINYKYCYDFQDSSVVRRLVDAWRSMSSQKSFEFSRYGYMFVSAFDPDRLKRLDLYDRLIARAPEDEGLWAAWIYVSYSVLTGVQDSLRAVTYAEAMYKKRPNRIQSIGHLLVAYNDAWLDDNTKTIYLEKAIHFTKLRQKMLPQDHPLYGREGESIKMYQDWIREFEPKKKIE